MKWAIAKYRTYVMVFPSEGLTTPYPMHTIKSRKKEKELRKAFRTATMISKTRAPMLEPLALR